MLQGIKYDYQGAHVLVTGGSKGIGHSIAEEYHAAGAHVTITGRAENASAYDDDLSSFSYRQLEITNKEQIVEVAGSLEKLDILVNNAGGYQYLRDSEWDPVGFDGALDVNLSSIFHLSHACFDHLKASQFAGGASIITISSMTAFYGYEPAPGYSAAKAAANHLTKTYGAVWADHGIRANAVAPGYIDTKMSEPWMDSINEKIATMPIKRIGQPKDIAAAVLFLTSPAASWITGQTLSVDGGYTVAI